jgi:DNA invertase Pin-like site-specific DNA recombinase
MSETRAIGYVRVSTTAQGDSGLGLQAQEDAITRAASSRDWEIARVFEDVESGASMRNRDGLAAALECLATGDADALIVAKLDRLARSVMDGCSLIERAKREGWALVVCDIQLDTGSHMGAFTAHVLLAFAELERGMISERTRAAKAVARAEGRPIGGRPKGVFMIPADVRERICRERSEGQSFRSIAQGLSIDGVPTALSGRDWSGETVRQVVVRGILDG